MHASILLTPFLLSLACAFKTQLYTSKQCTGTTSTFNTSVADGCMTDRAGSFLGLINNWRDADDNSLLLATYSDSTCCHANMIETFDWKVGCVEAKTGVQGWRVLNPNDPNTGKKGDDYTCGGGPQS